MEDNDWKNCKFLGKNIKKYTKIGGKCLKLEKVIKNFWFFFQKVIGNGKKLDYYKKVWRKI